MNDLLFCCPELSLCTLDAGVLQLNTAPNPYRLQVEGQARVALMCTTWYRWLENQGEDVVRRTFKRLQRAVDAIVGVEGYDTFELGLPPAGLDRVAALVKSQGVYRDRDLYNYQVGTRYPGSNWEWKRRRRDAVYTARQVEKVRVSLPCFAGIVPGLRRRVRVIKPDITPRQRLARNTAEPFLERWLRFTARGRRVEGVHFVGALTHMSRLGAVRALRGRSGHHGITRIPEYVFGTQHLDLPLPEVCRSALLESVEADEWVPAVGRPRYLADIRQHRAALAPPGYGELTFRHGEALSLGSMLICPSLEHVETLFPFEDKRNVVFCRRDFGDLREIAAAVERRESWCCTVAREGNASWRAWLDQLPSILRAGILDPIRDAL